MLPKISIVTPSFNRAEYLEDAILSVLEQGYPNFEHIVVDGGSCDNTVAVLQRYPHLYWVSEPDKGQSDAINKGFRMASGDLIAWLNDDDYYLPGALDAIGQFATCNSDADVIYGDSLFVDQAGRFLRVKKEHHFAFFTLLYCGCYIQSTATFFRRRLIEGGLALDLTYRVCMDYEYFVRLAATGKTFRYVSRPLGAFRWHESNRSLDAEERRGECLRIRKMWSKLKLPDKAYDTLAYIIWANRIGSKVLNGGYWNELKARRYRGIDTRWFHSRAGGCASGGIIV